MGGLTAYLRGMRKGYGLRVRGEDSGGVVETYCSGKIAEGHVRRDFNGGKRAEAKVIRQAWRGRGRGGGVGY